MDLGHTGSQMMNLKDFGDPFTFSLVPLSPKGHDIGTASQDPETEAATLN